MKRDIGILCAAFVILGLYGMYLYSFLDKLEAEALTRIAGTSFEDRLPDIKARLKEHAIRVAPEVLQNLKDALLKLPDSARRAVEKQLSEESKKLLAKAEAQMSVELTTITRASIETIEQGSPAKTPEERLHDVLAKSHDAYQEKMRVLVDTLYEDYAREAKQLNQTLEKLRQGKDLSEREKLEKELIEAWIVLVHKHEITKPEPLPETHND
jgi:hypothetical protein